MECKTLEEAQSDILSPDSWISTDAAEFGQARNIQITECEIIYLSLIHILEMGISPRGSIALMQAAKGWAYLSGREYVLPDDVQKMVLPVLSHRMVLKSRAGLRRKTCLLYTSTRGLPLYRRMARSMVTGSEVSSCKGRSNMP